MKFLNKLADLTPLQDEVFNMQQEVNQAINKFGKESVYNGTIGTLFDEDGNFVTLKSVYEIYDNLLDSQKAKYAALIEGNPTYLDAIKKWILNEVDFKLANKAIATIGGTGAISLSVSTCLDKGDTLIIPSLSWNNYKLIASRHGLELKNYQLFDNDKFNLNSFKEVCKEVLVKNKKVAVIINDPLHNPTGYSMSLEEWKEVINIINDLSKLGEIILINDIAYIDYTKKPLKSREYLTLFNNLNENALLVIAFSCSKTLTAYGLRLGAALIANQNQKLIDDLYLELTKHARSTWSNVPHGAMELFTKVTSSDYLENYLKEKQTFIDLLEKRGHTFKKECKNYLIPLYPHTGGFFITIKVSNEKKELIHQKLKENNIFLLKVNDGIRVGLCGLNIKKCKELPTLINKVLQENNLKFE